MPAALDLTGQKFNRLTAIKKAPSRGGKTYWICQCECGNIKEVQTTHLRNGAIKSCGCYADSMKIENRGQAVVDFRKRVKHALVEAFGRKCACCGLVDQNYIYDFHHIDPNTKEFGIGNASTTRSREAYLTEAKKCIMVCANCHRKIENNDCDISKIVSIIDDQVFWNTLESLKNNGS